MRKPKHTITIMVDRNKQLSNLKIHEHEFRPIGGPCILTYSVVVLGVIHNNVVSIVIITAHIHPL